MKVGDLVKSKYTGALARAGIGIVIKLREGAYEGQPIAQVFWPRRHNPVGWFDSNDMEVIDEGR